MGSFGLYISHKWSDPQRFLCDAVRGAHFQMPLIAFEKNQWYFRVDNFILLMSLNFLSEMIPSIAWKPFLFYSMN